MEAVVHVPETQGPNKRRSTPKGWAIFCDDTGYWHNGEALTEPCWSKERWFAKRYPTKRSAKSALAQINRKRKELNDHPAAARQASVNRTPRRRSIR